LTSQYQFPAKLDILPDIRYPAFYQLYIQPAEYPAKSVPVAALQYLD
jgi:hypothetical protein